MAAKRATKKTPRKRTSGAGRAVRAALATGDSLAREAVRLRNLSLRRRAAALRGVEQAAPKGIRTLSSAWTPDPEFVAAAGAPSPFGTLLAEGDSWFDYPFNDILKQLQEDHGYDIESVAHMGDRVEDMAYMPKQFERFTEAIDKLLRRSIIPRAILLSGGGNDMAGDEFAMLLDHARSPVPGFNRSVVDGIVDERIRYAYISLISAMTTLSKGRTGRIVPIVIHGYDYPVPDGRGLAGGWGPLPGPWLEPGFRQKGFENLAATTVMAGRLIDRFNGMLRSVASLPAFAHVHYIDLRGTLSNGPNYRTWWTNELHPTGRGFKAVAARFAATIGSL
jgi:lysophospholipase L1-like esterase